MRAWAREEASRHPELLRLGYFGSYARGNWGVGSDVDVVAVVSRSDQPRERRTLGWQHTRLPAPCDLIVMTREEWSELMASDRRFKDVLLGEAVWVYERDGAQAGAGSRNEAEGG